MRKIICLLLFILLLTCCNVKIKEGGVLIKDMLGREVAVPRKVNRIAGIRAGSLRLLIYMDAIDKIVGIEEGDLRNPDRPYMLANPELLQLPSIGPSMGGDAELILNIRPDVIFTAYSTVNEADELQKKTGIPVVALECPELGISAARDTLYASLRLIGNILDKNQRADSLINYMDNIIKDLNNRTSKNELKHRPTAYIGGVSYGATKDIASTQPYYPPFVFTNTVNVISSIDKKSVSHVRGTYIDKEQLLVWNPEYLFFDESGLSLIFNDLKPNKALFENLTAINENKMFTLLPYNNYAVNYELVFINCWFTGKILYPERFEDIVFEEKANEISGMFFGKFIYNRIITKNSFKRIDKEELK
jgi:iron complex transport system substrate-binding protein